MRSNILFSIVIPTCNRNDLLEECLGHLAPGKQTIEPALYEVIVTDDGKGQAARSLIEEKFPWATWIQGPCRGPAANRNNGANQASGEWLIFLDDDCIPAATLIDEYRNACSKNPDVEIFEGCITTDRPKSRFDEESPINESGGFLWSCNFMIRKLLFVETLKGFDEQFPFAAMEDVDLNYRIYKRGLHISFVKKAQVIHPWRLQQKMIKITNKRFQSLKYFLNKHPEKRKELNARYLLTIAYHDFIQLIKEGPKFHFKGSAGILAHAFLHICYAVIFVFKGNRISIGSEISSS